MRAFWLVLLAGCGAATKEAARAPVEICENDRDDDGDGRADCDDLECASVCDVDGDGIVDAALGGFDCDDGDESVHPGSLEVCNGRDDDCDGLTDDADPSVELATATTWYTDEDGDGAGTGEGAAACVAVPGSVAVAGDCDDTDATVSPVATEVCNARDDDCDLLVDDADPSLDTSGSAPFFADADGDGFGDPAAPVIACEQQPGVVDDDTDCAPFDAAVHAETLWWPDADGDGAGDPDGVPVLSCLAPAGHVASPDDCDDGDPDLGAPPTWFRDFDDDGFGNPYFSMTQCLQPAGYVADATDCDDLDPSRHVGASRFADLDEDGFGDASAAVDGCDLTVPSSLDDTDCDDGDRDVYPGGPELCDGRDNDCDGAADEVVDQVTWYADADADGYGNPDISTEDCLRPADHVSVAGDCDDLDPALSDADVDDDGLSTCDGDCDDHHPMVYPGAPEDCSGPDLDCDPSPYPLAWGAAQTLVTGADFTHFVRVVDLDRDGDLDVLQASRDDDTVSWVENLGGGTFSAELVISATSDGAWTADVADLDGDGLVDVLVASAYDGTISWHRNLGGGAFAAEQRLTTSAEGTAVVWLDVDADGDLDVLGTEQATDAILLFENLGGGAFAAPITPWYTFDVSSMATGDFDGDGDLDVVTGSFESESVITWENVGGAFTYGTHLHGTDTYDPSQPDLIYGPFDVTTGDVNGDGLDDIASPVLNAHAVDLWRSLGVDAFEYELLSDDVHGAARVELADLDGDGDLDAVAVGSDADEVVWIENLGSFFGGAQTIGGGFTGAMGVSAGDLDGDGLVDLVVASSELDSVSWLPGSCE